MLLCHHPLVLPGGNMAVIVGASGPRATLMLQRMVEDKEPRAWHPGDHVAPILALDAHIQTPFIREENKLYYYYSSLQL